MTEHVNHRQLFKRIVADTGVPEKVVKRVVESFQDEIIRALVAGESVRMTNFLSLNPVEKGERVARNPQNGESVFVPAQRSVRVTVMPRVIELVKADVAEINGQLITLRKTRRGTANATSAVTR